MKHANIDKRYRFVSVFDDETGAYLRTGVLDGCGHDTGRDPFMASFAHQRDRTDVARPRAAFIDDVGVAAFFGLLFVAEGIVELEFASATELIVEAEWCG